MCFLVILNLLLVILGPKAAVSTVVTNDCLFIYGSGNYYNLCVQGNTVHIPLHIKSTITWEQLDELKWGLLYYKTTLDYHGLTLPVDPRKTDKFCALVSNFDTITKNSLTTTILLQQYDFGPRYPNYAVCGFDSFASCFAYVNPSWVKYGYTICDSPSCQLAMCEVAKQTPSPISTLRPTQPTQTLQPTFKPTVSPIIPSIPSQNPTESPSLPASTPPNPNFFKPQEKFKKTGGGISYDCSCPRGTGYCSGLGTCCALVPECPSCSTLVTYCDLNHNYCVQPTCYEPVTPSPLSAQSAGCFFKDDVVELINSRQRIKKKIGQLELLDELFENGKVLLINDHPLIPYAITFHEITTSCGSVSLSINHIVTTNKGKKTAGDIRLNETISNADGDECTITSLRPFLTKNYRQFLTETGDVQVNGLVITDEAGSPQINEIQRNLKRVLLLLTKMPRILCLVTASISIIGDIVIIGFDWSYLLVLSMMILEICRRKLIKFPIQRTLNEY